MNYRHPPPPHTHTPPTPKPQNKYACIAFNYKFSCTNCRQLQPPDYHPHSTIPVPVLDRPTWSTRGKPPICRKSLTNCIT